MSFDEAIKSAVAGYMAFTSDCTNKRIAPKNKVTFMGHKQFMEQQHSWQ
jgi:hypothetical protein